MKQRGIKTFKFIHKSGQVYRVKFYSTGFYTITDANGEHERGTWDKRIYYHAVSFARASNGRVKCFGNYPMRDLARDLLDWERMKQTIE